MAKALDDVHRDHEPMIITRQKGEPAVLMSLEDFTAWQETAYLLRSPENAKRLREAIRQIEAGRGKARKLTGLLSAADRDLLAVNRQLTHCAS